MLTLRSPLLAVVLGLASLPAQAPAHSSPMLNTPTFPEFRVVQQGDAVHISERDGRYYRSLDGGRAWTLLPQVLPLIKVTDFACGSGMLIAAGLEGDQPYWPSIARSTDNGVTWQGPIRIGFNPLSYTDARVRVHIDGSNVVGVWRVIGGVWTNRSTDGGVSWSTATQLNTLAATGNAGETIAAGATIQVFWHSPYGPSELQQVSTDGGLTWLPAPRSRPATQYPARIAGEGNDLYAVNGNAALDQSHDGGITWISAPVPGMQNCISVACAGQTVLVAGSSTSPAFAYTLNVSTDAGVTWQSNPWSAGSAPGFMPWLYVTPNDLHAHFQSTVWADLVLHSGDLGATWSVVQGSTDAFSPGPRRNIHIVRVPVGSSYYDAVYVGTGYTRTGTGLAGTGGVAPELRLDGLPHLGANTTLRVEGAVGGSLGVLGFAFAAPLATPLGPATVWLQGPLVLATIATTGATGAAGVGTAAMALAIPANPALIDANLTSQALVLDAAVGFTVTNAVEVWMR